MYRIPCECGLVYIGETGRNLSVRLKEHKTNCEKAEQDKSAVAKHTWTYDHRIKWDEATILAIDSHKFSRKMRESIEIEKHNFIYLFIYLASPIITQYNNTYTQPFLSNPKTRKLQRNVHDCEIKPRMV